MIINKKEDVLMKFGDIDIKIYESKKENEDDYKDVVLVVGNKKLICAATLNGGTELKFYICDENLRKYTLVDNKVNHFGFNMQYMGLVRISKWHTADDLVKRVKNAAHACLLQKGPSDSAWICYRYGKICIADENNHWILKMDPKLLRYISIKQSKGGCRMKWPSDRIPVSEDNTPLMPLEYVVKTLQANRGVIYDPFAWDEEENEITFKTVTK
jgi:hypothetical protein